MNTKAIRQMTELLDQRRKQIAELKHEASLLTLNCNQEEIRVSVGKSTRSIAVTAMGRDYMHKMIRGREMILLGVKKVYAAIIEEFESDITELEKKIAEEVQK